jgi:ribonuclease Z
MRPTMPRRPLIALLVFLAVAGSSCDQIADRLLDRGISQGLQGSRAGLLDDGRLNVVLCGTGSPLATVGRASACTAILAGGHFFIVDAGPGAMRNVGVWKLPLDHLDGLLITHFHSDHIGEIGEAGTQSWIAGRTGALPVYGPPGVDQVVAGFQQAYALDRGYRVKHHGATYMPPEGGALDARTVTLPGPDEAAVVFDGDGLRVTAFRVDHTPVAPAYGYRFDYGGRSVVVSGDTKRVQNLVRHAQGASVLVQEALAAHMIQAVSRALGAAGNARLAKLSSDILEYHTTPVEAIDMAREAGVQALVLTHLVPGPTNRLAEWLFMRGTSGRWDGEVILGKDGMHVALPRQSTELSVEELS